MNRLTYGWTPELDRQVHARGGALAWFESQLSPESIRDSFAAGLSSWFPRLTWSPARIVKEREADNGIVWEVMEDFNRWTLLRRAYSQRQVLEVMAEFWSNLLHVPIPDSKSWPFRVGYDSVIRSHSLGRFDQMLHAAITHPAMLCYLDNARSVAANPNENLGRELLELHTVGRMGGYTEQDVRQSTMILTGYRVDAWRTWEVFYSPEEHYVGPVSVMAFSDPNGDPDGKAVVRRYIQYLAHHPATAQRIAHRLCVRFVSDDPPARLVNHLKNVYLNSGTDIKAVLRALVRHADFGSAMGSKVRTPTEDVVATLRVLRIKPTRPEQNSDLAHFVLPLTAEVGQRPFDWARPDGTPDNNEAWTGASRLLGSWKVHANIGGGYWPQTGATRPRESAWLPPLPSTFRTVVDHVARQTTGRPADRRTLQAACIASGLLPGSNITADHPFVSRGVADVITTLLDSPAHMKR